MSNSDNVEYPVTPDERLKRAVIARISAAHNLLGLLVSHGLDNRPRLINSNLEARALLLLAALWEERRASREASIEEELTSAGLGGVLEKLPPESRL